MADKHPYISGPGTLTKTFTQFRKSFPSTVTAVTLKKLGLAPNNESYVLNILKFLELIEDDGAKTELATKIFTQHSDTEFQKLFAQQVKKAYKELFDLHGEDSWKLDKDGLIQFFRSSDGSTEIVGQRQAGTFQVLSAFAGHADIPPVKETTKKTATPQNKAKTNQKPAKPLTNTEIKIDTPIQQTHDVGLTVRVEINLPAQGDQETYDRIFKSIRQNLLNT